MKLYRFSLAILLLFFFFFFNSFTSANSNPSHFTDDVSINCGSGGTSAARNGRQWFGDILQSKSSVLVKTQGSSSITSSLISVDDPVPYETARISRSRFSYAFRVNPGQKILRLHFNPASYRGFKRHKDSFGVEAGGFTLLSNFSASLAGVNPFVKEYCMNIEENEELDVAFTPASSPLMETYAFINGIEIISVPDGVSYFHRGDHNVGVQVVGKPPVYVDNSTALELIQRLSVKQDDMFGMWETVNPKRKASRTNNVTWEVSVDVGFSYLVRLHFLESAGVPFRVSINDMVVDSDVDIAREKGDDDSFPLCRDYMVMMKGHKEEGKKDLLISLQSDHEFLNRNGPVKGFEVMKLSNLYNSLASPNPMLPNVQDSSYSMFQILFQVLGYRNMIAAIATIVLVLVDINVYALGQIWEARGTEEENMPSARAERLCRRFSLAEIKLATKRFSHAHLIGKGGFGKVYKGIIDSGWEIVAIKRLKPDSSQGAREFLTEIETLTELRHVNLVSLIGFCNEQWEMILVYEYVSGGTLADHLYKVARNNDYSLSLTWKQRLNICIGAGRGLDYLHTGCSLIHRDVKASNILLDENFTAKVSDFGLAKHLSRSKLESHVSTKVKGTFGYLDPNYLITGKLTMKSDTYAFGVVLLEVLSGRRAVNPSSEEDEQILTKWARENIIKGTADQIVDSNLRDEMTKDSLTTFVGIAERCLDDEPKKRPTMAQVVQQLELALEQQENSKSELPNKITTNDVVNVIKSSNDNTNFPASNEQRAIASTDMQNLAPHPKEEMRSKVVNDEIISGRNDRRKATKVYKQLRPWLGFWNRDNKKVREAESFTWNACRGIKEEMLMETLAGDRIQEAKSVNWNASKGIKEELLMKKLPEERQRYIRHRLLTARIFRLLDESVIDAICLRLRIRTYMRGSKIFYEDGLVDKMVITIRGRLDSSGNGVYGNVLWEGHVCADEVPVWCLEQHCYKDGKRIRVPRRRLLSSRDVTCSTEVEAAVLRAADLEEFASLYGTYLRSPHIQGAIRYLSPLWRELAVRRIQFAWRNIMKRKGMKSQSSAKLSPSHTHSSITWIDF